MKICPAVYVFALAFAGTAAAQQWELGAAGGWGLYRNASVSSASGATGQAGFDSGAAVGVFGIQNMYKHLSGEFRYTCQLDDLEVSASGQKVTFEGQSHAIHYDLLLYANGKDAAVRPFLAGGGGIKIYRGTGTETLTQPLSDFAILTKTQQVEGLITVGGGLRFRLGRRARLYTEFRDYITPMPQQVVAPGLGAKMSGWLHNFVPLVGLSVGF